MTAGVILKEIESNLLGIDDEGNLVLATVGKMAGQIANGNIPNLLVVGGGSSVAITNVAGGTQYYSLITFQVTDAAGAAAAGVFNLDVLLSDAASGAGLASHAPSGGATFTVGAALQIYTAAKAFRVQTDATGKAVMQVIDSSKTGYYPVATYNNRTVVGAQLTTASYHA